MKYNHQKIEKKWQKLWEAVEIYKISDKVNGKKNFYHLAMFPYPSGDLHIGHWYNFAPADVYARFKRMQGFNVMSPIGFDAFGLPAENAAIKRGIHPGSWTKKNIKTMRKQLKSMGTIYDWSREIITCEPEYYKWTQWMFLQLYKKGLAYRDKAIANWCPSCKTVLANEQVVEGKCERCDSEVLQKEIEQWLFKISAYAEDLLKDLDEIDWPPTTKIMQRNWIGKSDGWNIKFQISRLRPSGFGGQEKSKLQIDVFTTRADTLFGCAYLVLAPEHRLIEELKDQILNYKYVKQYIEEIQKKTERERISDLKEKTGVELKGIKAVNPVNNREIPIFAADYVLAHYGTGAVMAVPAHDQRDFDFAKKYDLPIIEVIQSEEIDKTLLKKPSLIMSDGRLEGAYEGDGILFHSGRFDGLQSKIARDKIGGGLAQKNQAQKKIYYRLKDWLISRQRYWGSPIPMVYCQKCGWQPVVEKDLPIILPKIKDFKPTSEGKSPLAKSKNFVETNCPKCKGSAQRETDTMDTFVCSSWYFLRYADPRNEKQFASKDKINSWLPVNMYIGGAEHSVMHLLYSRFFVKALKDLGRVNFQEPFLKLRHQGIILGPDGQKMSKSKGNIVDPDEQVRKYGSDAVRMYLCFMGPYNQGGPWNPNGLVGVYRFLNRVWDLADKKNKTKNEKETGESGKNEQLEIQNKQTEQLLQKTIKKVTEDIDSLRFNTAVSALMILVNHLAANGEKPTEKNLKTLLLLLAPFAPHITEELWLSLAEPSKSDKTFAVKNSIHNQEWPKYEEGLLGEKKYRLIIQINGKIRDKIEVDDGIGEEEAKKLTFGREKVKNWVVGKEIKKIVFIPGKLINIVV